MKKIVLFIFTSLSFVFIKAQDINIGNQVASLYDCVTPGSLYDSGGPGGSYTAGESFILTICTTAPTPIALEFVSANFGHPNDFMAVYDGGGTVNPVDLIYSFSQTSAQSVGDIYRTTIANVSGCITIQFVSDAASTGGDLEFTLLCLPPCKSVIANNPLTSIAPQPTEPNYIHSCDDTPITFTGSGTYDANLSLYTQSDATSTFYWDFGASGLDTGQIVNQSFAPGIYPVKLIVEDVSGCRSINEVDLRVRQTLNPNVKFLPADTIMCLGDSLNVSSYLITTSNEILFVGDTAVFDTLNIQTSVEIQDTSYLPDDSDGITGNGITTPAVFEFPIFGYQPGAILTNVNDLFYVCIDIEHSFIGDLDIILECPNGQTTTLVDFNPPGNALGSNFGEPDPGTGNGVQGVPYTYCWSPMANPSDSIAQGNAGLVILANGAVDTSIQYYPVGNDWNGLIGCPLNGDWTIQVFDDYGSDDGFVFGAAIEFDGSFALDPDTFVVAYSNPSWDANPQISSPLNSNSVDVNLITDPFQTLTFNFEDNLGCTWSEDYNGITVSSLEVESVFEDTSICFPDSLTIVANVLNPQSNCSYSIEMFDSFGDSWNGNIVNILLDGVVAGTYDVDFVESTYSLETFTVTNGQQIEIQYDNSVGNFNNEVSFNILDSDGLNLFSANDPAAGILFTTTANCNGGIVYNWTPAGQIISTDDNEASIYPTTSGDYIVTVVNEHGCEASDTSSVTVFSLEPDTITNISATCIVGDTGTVISDLMDSNGCDSVYIEIVNFLASFNDTVNLSSCLPADTGVIVQNLMSQGGCDSNYVSITILVDTVNTSEMLTTCIVGDTGSIISSFTGQNGCDSVHTVTTTLLSSDAVTINLTSCNPADAGTVVQNFTSQNGCDSSITTITTLLNSDAVTINLTSCNPLDVGSVVQNLMNQAGCDSIVTTNTTLLNSDAVTINLTSCNPANVGTVTLNLMNQAGCDSIVTINTTLVTSNFVIDFSMMPVELCCIDFNTSFVISDYVSGDVIDEMYINGFIQDSDTLFINPLDFSTDSLNYTIEVIAPNGCSSTEDVTFYRNCINPSIVVVDTIFVGGSEVFNINTVNQYDSMTYAWSTTDVSNGAITDSSLQNAQFNGITENPPYAAIATVTAYINQNNGDVLECPEDAVSMLYEVVDILDLRYPDAFTPNGDDVNNVFRPIMSEYAEILDFRVYNRWGDIVYDISKSDNKDGWDGTFNGKEQPSELYMYFITVKNFNEVITKEGALTLIR